VKSNRVIATIATVIFGIALLLACAVSALGSFDKSSQACVDPFALEKAAIFTDCNVVFISSIDGEVKIISLAPNVRIQETFDNIGGTDIVIIDSEYATSLGRTYLSKNVETLVKHAHPVMIKGADRPWIFGGIPGISIGFSTDKEDLFCLFYDSESGASYGNSISGRNIQESLEIAYEWALPKVVTIGE